MMDVTGVRKIKICDQKKDTEQMDTFCLLFWVGCIHEEKGKNGTAHILEHMIVHYISERAKRYYGKPIVCVGKTEYDHIMIRFDVGNEVVGISGEVFCLHIIDEIIEGRMLSVELFNISLAEVKGEAKDKKRTIEEQKIIVKRLTDNAISNHPVGDEYDLSQIRFGDIKNFFDYVVLGEEWGVVLLGDNIKDYKEIIRSHNIVEKKIYDYGKEQNGNTEVITNGIYRYFFPSYSKDEIEYIEKMIIMNALENRLVSYKHLRAQVYEKTFSLKYRYIYMAFRDKFDSEVLNRIVANRLSQSEFELSQRILIQYVYQCKNEGIRHNKSSKIDALLRYYLYWDKIVDLDDYDQLIVDIKKVCLERLSMKWQNMLNGE